MKLALLLLNGELEDPAAARRLARSGVPVLCADGGTRHAAALGLRPKLVLGDMDSLPARLPRWSKTAFLCDFDPALSDFEKALRFMVCRGVRKAWVAGALGGRLDHEVVNLALMESYSAHMAIGLADGSARILRPGTHSLPCRKGDWITLLPAAPQARVTTAGLLYPLKGSRLTRASRGLSNRATGSRLRIRVHSGRLWLISRRERFRHARETAPEGLQVLSRVPGSREE